MKIKVFVFVLMLGAAGCWNPMKDVRQADRLALQSGQDYVKAVALYAKALAHLPRGKNKEVVRLKLGRLYAGKGDTEGAVRVLAASALIEGRRLFAEALFHSGAVTDALEVFNKIGDSGPAGYRYAYGLTLEKNNLFDQALRLYASLRNDPSYGARAAARIAAINLTSGEAAFAGIDPAIRKLIEASPGVEAYPEAAALILFSDETMTLTDDSRLVSEVHMVIKILNDRGKEAYGEVSMGYDATYEKLDVAFARTIAPDGRVITVGDKNIRDVSVYLNFPLYSNARARIISMPEVAAGSVIEYKATITQSKLPNKKDFDAVYWLQADDPILWQRCTLSVPKDKPLKSKIVNGAFNVYGYDMAPKVKAVNNRLEYTLEFKNVPQIIPEAAMPPETQINPYVLLSTFKSWEDVASWWRGLVTDKMTPDAAIRAKVAELVNGKTTPEQKIRAIYNFCAQEIRYVAVEYGDAGYEPHNAAEIFANKYGDCKDKAVLLVTMLSAAGVEAYPVLISTWDSLQTQDDRPTLLFNHAIAAVRLNGAPVFMDPTAATVSFGDLPVDDQDRLTLVFFPDRAELVMTPSFGPSRNSMATHMKISVAKDGSVKGERRVQTQGSYQQAQRAWLKFTMPALIEQGLKQKVRALADNAVLEHYDITGVDDLDAPVSLSYRFSAPLYFIEAGPIRILNRFGSIDTSTVSRETRRYPITWSGLASETDVIEIEFPRSFKVKYIPPPVTAETPWFYFSTVTKDLGDGRLRFESKRRVKARQVPVEAYQDYKKKIEEIARSVNQHVVLEEGRK
jgi:transglutaminase-like putative cysteine protease